MHGVQVIANDVLRFNHQVALALVRNDSVILSEGDVREVLTRDPSRDYPTFIQDTFRDIYYTEEENAFLDMAVTNIRGMEDEVKRALAFSALGQACLVKRPFNLFHRKNLYVRFAPVERSFGNKTTWDREFAELFVRFSREFNRAVFSNGRDNGALNGDALDVEAWTDLVYIDPPYVSEKGISVDYSHFYHFLEGMVDYERWPARIDMTSKHRRMMPSRTPWTDRNEVGGAFDRLMGKFSDRTVAVSYRTPGIPSEDRLVELMGQHYRQVKVVRRDYKYVLSKREGTGNGELLIVGHD